MAAAVAGTGRGDSFVDATRPKRRMSETYAAVDGTTRRVMADLFARYSRPQEPFRRRPRERLLSVLGVRNRGSGPIIRPLFWSLALNP